MAMITPLTIGIPVKNEENTISSTLLALKQALNRLDKHVQFETIVCLNGTTDNTLAVIQSLQHCALCKDLHLSVVRSRAGKLVAEQKIANVRKLKGFILYCDADVIIDKLAIKKLYECMYANDALRVACAKVLPIFNGRLNNFQKIMKAYYEMRYLLPQRGCFHGRMFIVRDAQDILKKYNLAPRLKRVPHNTVKKLYLDKGPICDDIILSAAIVHKYGQDAIRRVPTAKVYFYPPDNRYDFFLGVRRYTIEMQRINTLFPEYAAINTSKHFERPVKINKWTLFRRKKHLAETLMEFELFLSNLVKKYELENHSLELWETVKSSKPKPSK